MSHCSSGKWSVLYVFCLGMFVSHTNVTEYTPKNYTIIPLCVCTYPNLYLDRSCYIWNIGKASDRDHFKNFKNVFFAAKPKIEFLCFHLLGGRSCIIETIKTTFYCLIISVWSLQHSVAKLTTKFNSQH